MPKITNPKGIAINTRGFIRLSFLRLLIASGYWKREGQNGDTFAVKPELKSMPPLSPWPGLLPLARHYSSRKCNNIDSSSFYERSLTREGLLSNSGQF